MAATRHRVRTVLVVAKPDVPEGLGIAREMGTWLRDRGVRVQYDRRTARSLGLPDGAPPATMPRGTDLAIVAGGDGTLLSVARVAVPAGVPILGVNFGGLGFMTELQPEELFDGLERIVSGRFTIEERQTLRVRLRRARAWVAEHAVLNDAVVSKHRRTRMITIEVRVDGDLAATVTSDGLIVSTPTGSTAYNLSAGGPILDPRMKAFVLSPICPHTLSYRPIVVPGGIRMRATVRNLGDEEAVLTLDGQVSIPMRDLDTVFVEAHRRPAQLVRVAGRGFFEVLHRKLGWGER